MNGRARGYTLVEVVVVLGIIAVVAAIAIPVTLRSRQRSELNEKVREVQAKVTQARSLASSGQSNPAWPAGARVQSAGLRFISGTQYAVFIDNDVAAGGELDVSFIDFQQVDPGTRVEIVAPAPPSELRIRSTGRLEGADALDITLRDNGSRVQKTVRVSLSGAPRIL